MDEYVRRYKLARIILKRSKVIGSFDTWDCPMLNDAAYSYYVQNYEKASNYKQRAIVLPTYWQKAIPYRTQSIANEKSKKHNFSDNYYWIYIAYRQAEKMRYPYIDKDLYGFVDADGKNIIPAQYQFAYPFDEKHGLALVQHSDGKWGYIDMEGKPRTQQNYDVASDVFVEGKANVIRDGHLILIDTDGNELKSLYGYENLYHKLQKDEMIAASLTLKNNYDLIDFKGNIVATSLKKDNVDEYTTGGCTLHSKLYITGQEANEIIKQEKIVDLGLSVKWAGWNVGATPPEGHGIECGWADPTGKDKAGAKNKKWRVINPVIDSKTKKWIGGMSYGGVNPPESISGTSLDIATAIWGQDWRLPTKDEMQELIEKCQWQEVVYKGIEGYIVTGPNKNRIFLEKWEYWSGNLDTSNQNNALALHYYFNGPVYASIKIITKERSGSDWGNWRPQIRPVYIK